MCVCLSVGLLVCLLFIGHTTFVHFAALPPSGRESRSRRRGRRGAGASMHSESTRAHAVQLLNEKIVRCADAFQKQLAVRARACCRIRNCLDFQKKGKKKTNMPLPKFCLQFAFSWSVYFSNRTESYLLYINQLSSDTHVLSSYPFVLAGWQHNHNSLLLQK